MSTPIYSRIWFTPTNFDEFLNIYKDKPNVNFLEIGSFEGQGTNYFIDNFLSGKNSRITCIDPWIKYGEASLAKMNEWDDVMNESTYNIFCSNVKHNIDKIIIHRGFSIDILPQINDLYDFIYVDGDHSKEAVYKDAILSFEKLKINGILIFDDYLWENNGQSPKIAIDKFLDEYNDKINVLMINYQVIIKKLNLYIFNKFNL